MDSVKKRIIGFSTLGVEKSKPDYSYYDYDIAKRDLINRLYTRKGERLMLPEYGTIVWDMLMEPMIDANIDKIRFDIKDNVENDPRFNFMNMALTEYPNGLSIQIILEYIPTRTVEEISLNFDRSLAARQ